MLSSVDSKRRHEKRIKDAPGQLGYEQVQNAMFFSVRSQDIDILLESTGPMIRSDRGIGQGRSLCR